MKSSPSTLNSRLELLQALGRSVKDNQKDRVVTVVDNKGRKNVHRHTRLAANFRLSILK